jgi:hypothetical protein
MGETRKWRDEISMFCALILVTSFSTHYYKSRSMYGTRVSPRSDEPLRSCIDPAGSKTDNHHLVSKRQKSEFHFRLATNVQSTSLGGTNSTNIRPYFQSHSVTVSRPGCVLAGISVTAHLYVPERGPHWLPLRQPKTPRGTKFS